MIVHSAIVPAGWVAALANDWPALLLLHGLPGLHGNVLKPAWSTSRSDGPRRVVACGFDVYVDAVAVDQRAPAAPPTPTPTPTPATETAGTCYTM